METSVLPSVPREFDVTREALRARACFVLAPARKAVDGHIGLRPVRGGFGTPDLGAGRMAAVRGSMLVVADGTGEERSLPLTTLRAAADAVTVVLAADPGVGADVPPFEPDAPLVVDESSSNLIGAWYALGATVFAGLFAVPHPERGGDAATSDPTIWPEHFDYAVVHRWGPPDDEDRIVNVGFSVGDASTRSPYLYVGPWRTEALDDPFWNRPFGAQLDYADVAASPDPAAAARAFVLRGLELLARRS